MTEDDPVRAALAQIVSMASKHGNVPDDCNCTVCQMRNVAEAALCTPAPLHSGEPVAWRIRLPDGGCTAWFDGKPPNYHGPYEVAYGDTSPPAIELDGGVIDRETAQILLDLLNPLHGALDYQIHINSEGEHVYDAPPDYEHSVTVLAQQDRDLTQAVCILENRLRSPQLAAPKPERAVARELIILHLAKRFPQTFTMYGDGKNLNALVANVADAIVALHDGGIKDDK